MQRQRILTNERQRILTNDVSEELTSWYTVMQKQVTPTLAMEKVQYQA